MFDSLDLDRFVFRQLAHLFRGHLISWLVALKFRVSGVVLTGFTLSQLGHARLQGLGFRVVGVSGLVLGALGLQE